MKLMAKVNQKGKRQLKALIKVILISILKYNSKILIRRLVLLKLLAMNMDLTKNKIQI